MLGDELEEGSWEVAVNQAGGGWPDCGWGRPRAREVAGRTATVGSHNLRFATPGLFVRYGQILRGCKVHFTLQVVTQQLPRQASSPRLPVVEVIMKCVNGTCCKKIPWDIDNHQCLMLPKLCLKINVLVSHFNPDDKQSSGPSK